MELFIFENYDSLDGQHGVCLVIASDRQSAEKQMLVVNKKTTFGPREGDWTLENRIPIIADKEEILYSVYLG